jgi:uncharacterized protein
MIRNADHYLLIGPYDHLGSQNVRKPEVLRSYAIDPAAQINTPEITFQWLDYILRGGKKPELLNDKINYEVMGANEWKHAPSLDRTRNETLTLYLTDKKSGDKYQLAKERPTKFAFLEQEVNFADRASSDFDYYPAPIVGKKQDFERICIYQQALRRPCGNQWLVLRQDQSDHKQERHGCRSAVV